MRLIICTADVSPCPPEAVASITMTEAFDPLALGITAEQMLKVYAFGFGAVFSMFVFGLCLGWAVGLVRKL